MVAVCFLNSMRANLIGFPAIAELDENRTRLLVGARDVEPSPFGQSFNSVYKLTKVSFLVYHLNRIVDANATKNATFRPLPRECNLLACDSNEGCCLYAERQTWTSSRKALFLEVQPLSRW